MSKLTHKEKQIWVEETKRNFEGNFEGIGNIIITEYKGLNVQEISELRNKLRKVGYHYQVVKNRLIKQAFVGGHLEGLVSFFKGPIAIVYGEGEVTSTAKVIKDFSKKYDNLKVTAGIVGGELVSVDQINSIANLPPRDVLLAQLGRTMLGPITSFANVLQGTIRELVYVLESVRKKKEG